ncbi:MAG: sulfotransferase, partial [Pseudomonas sp.]|nr:sulfotransferase [Pseudomonas sp.]
MNTSAGVDVYGYLLDASGAAAWQRAASLAQSAQYASAIDALAGLLRADPAFVPALVQAAHWAMALGRYRDARGLVRRAATAIDRSPALLLEVVRLLRRFEDAERIAGVLQQVDWRGCTSAPLLLSIAAELPPAGLYTEAGEVLNIAEGLDPSNPVLLGLRATLDLTTGNEARARPALERVASQGGPAGAHAHWLLSLRSPRELGRPRADEVRRQMERVEPGSEAEAQLAFALHNVLHAWGEFDQAWSALERGCEVKRARLQYDAGRQRALIEAIAALPRFDPVATTERDSPIPVFVVGMHRSGTTLLERMLAGHDGVADGGESYVFSAAFRHATDHYAPQVIDLEGVRRAERGIDLRA